MKGNGIWMLIAGIAVGYVAGQEITRSRLGGGSGGETAKAETAAKPSTEAGPIPAEWLTEDALGAKESMAGMTPAQRFAALKFYNETPCDCGCPHGSYAKCKKEDPGCPRAPKVLEQAVALAKQGKSYTEIAAATKKPAGGDAPGGGAAPSETAKVDVPASSPVKGAKNAKVTVVLFSDFQCPFCSRVGPTIKEIEEKFPNDVRIVWRDQPLPFHNHAVEAAEAARAAHAQGKFWQMHDKLFANQQKLERADLDGYAKELGLDMGKFAADMNSHKYKDSIDTDSKAGSGFGASGTPTLFVNGRKIVGAQPFSAFEPIIKEEIKHADELLAKGTPKDKLYEKLLETIKAAPPTAAPAAAEPPKHVDIKPGDAPSKGPKNAPVTIVIFSDFQCPFCSRVEPTLTQLEKDYPGKIRFAWKNQPLPFHQNAGPAAEAAMAAHAQGKFWEMHDKLFANQQSLDRAHYEQWAGELGLDMAKFKADLDSGKWKDKIKADSEEGTKVGASGTPTFFINGNQLVGAQPLDAFKKEVDAALAKK